jgi:prepilin-type N-terminal cleavage/methylation domain-containing protein/prepilin-type processing-associated H-X9-DG protein
MRHPRRQGFSIIELLVVIGIISILIAIIFPMAERMRHRAYIDSCASNLRQIGQAMEVYAGDNSGSYPRATYKPDADWTAGSDHAASDVFTATPHAMNDITASVFLLMRVEGLPPKLFICPYNDVKQYIPDPEDPYQHGNFTDFKQNLGYSFQNMYPSSETAANGFKWTNKFGAEFAMAADLNPGPGDAAPFDNLTAVSPTSTSSVREKGNSPNHESEGQNVLYGDGHVAYVNTCLAGARQDNIYINRSGSVHGSPADREDSMLLPLDAPH